MKGVFEFEVGEPVKKIGFKFGTMALAKVEEKEGKPVSQILAMLQSRKVSTMMVLHILYGAAFAYAEQRGLPTDFTVADVSDWCEEIGFEKMNEVIKQGLNQHVPKNSNPPVKTGEKQEITA